jgi:hypothetical protein
MPRTTTTIAAVLAMLVFLAPAASARPADVGYPAYPTPEVTAQPKVMPERITDHPVLPTADEIKTALAQEQSYSTKGNPEVGGLVLEQESTSGSGNQGVAQPADKAAPPAEDDNAPWLIFALGIGAAVLAGGALTVVARRSRTRVAT